MRLLIAGTCIILSFAGSFLFNRHFEKYISRQMGRDLSSGFFHGQKIPSPSISFYTGSTIKLNDMKIKLGKFDAFVDEAVLKPNWLNLFSKGSIISADLYNPEMRVDLAYFEGPSLASNKSRNALKYMLKKISVNYHNGNLRIRQGRHMFHFLGFNGKSDLKGNLHINSPLIKYSGSRGVWAGKNMKAHIRGTSLEQMHINFLTVYTPGGENYNLSGNLQKITSDVYTVSMECFRESEYFKFQGTGSIWDRHFKVKIKGYSDMNLLEKYFRKFFPAFDIPHFMSGKVEGEASLNYKNKLEEMTADVTFPAVSTIAGPLSSGNHTWKPVLAKLKLDNRVNEKKLDVKFSSGEISGDLNVSREKSGLIIGKFNLHETTCDKLYKWFPDGFLGSLNGMKLSGETGWSSAFSINPANPESFNANGYVHGSGCSIEKFPEKVDVQELKNPVKVILKDDLGRKLTRVLGPENPDFIAFEKIPPHLFGAFVALEDRRFMQHNGFDWPLIVKAIGFNLEHRQFRKGASSISQQLVKNLYLTGERTIARKIEEGVITWMMEKTLDKKRIFELYINIIEMGPGLRGINDGARTYFQRSADNLAPRMSIHLASLTPAPRYYWKMFRKKAVPDRWTAIIRKNLQKLYRMGTITREELKQELELGLIISDY